MADKYRLTARKHGRATASGEYVEFVKGDILELTEQESASFGDKFEPVANGKVAEGGAIGDVAFQEPAAAAPEAAADAPEPASDLEGLVSEKIAGLLADAGYDSLAAIGDASDEDLLAIKGIGKGTVKNLRKV